MKKEERTYLGYEPTKRQKDGDQDNFPVLDDDQLRLLEQQREFTPDYLYDTFKELEEAIRTNEDLRAKYVAEPEKFYQSEATLNEAVSRLTSISAYPALIQDFIRSNVLKLVVQLLEHPNQSIVGEAVQVLYQFLMMEIQDEKATELHLKYWRQICDESFLTRLLGLLKRLNQELVAQYQIVYKILRVVEQILTVFPDLSNLVVDCSQIMRYLADRILPNFIVEFKTIDDSKFVATQVLVELLQFSKQNRFTFGKFNGMQVLLECISPYMDKKQDIKEMELEFLSNIFDLVCITNIEPEAQDVFNQNNGIGLMLHFVKLKNYFSKHALKCLASGMTESSIRQFIDLGGLKYVFAVLLHQGVKGKEVDDQMVIDENSTQIILVLLQHCSTGTDLDRVIYKFKEKNFQKLLRVVEMRVEYSDSIQETGQQLEEKEYVERLGKGLRNIELLDLILLHLAVKNPQLKSNIEEMFNHFQFDLRKIQTSLHQHASHLSPSSSQHTFIKQQSHQMFSLPAQQ